MKSKQIEPITDEIGPIIDEDMSCLDSLLPDFSEPFPGEQDFLNWLNEPIPELDFISEPAKPF